MRGAWQRWLYQDEHLLVELLSGCLGTSQDALSISSLLTFPPPSLTLQVFIGCYYKSMTSIFSLSEDLSLCAPPTCFLIGDHHLIRVFSYTEGSLPCYIKRLEATWCELRYHYKQLKNTNWNLSMTVTLPFPLSVGSQIWVFSKTCKKFSICVRHFFPLVIKIKQKNDRAKAHVSRLIFNCNLSVRLRFMELQSCDKTYLL